MDGYVEKGDGDVSSGYGFKNSNTIFQHDDSSNCNEMGGDVDKVGVISWYGFMKSYNKLQRNVLE